MLIKRYPNLLCFSTPDIWKDSVLRSFLEHLSTASKAPQRAPACRHGCDPTLGLSPSGKTKPMEDWLMKLQLQSLWGPAWVETPNCPLTQTFGFQPLGELSEAWALLRIPINGDSLDKKHGEESNKIQKTHTRYATFLTFLCDLSWESFQLVSSMLLPDHKSNHRASGA